MTIQSTCDPYGTGVELDGMDSQNRTDREQYVREGRQMNRRGEIVLHARI